MKMRHQYQEHDEKGSDMMNEVFGMDSIMTYNKEEPSLERDGQGQHELMEDRKKERQQDNPDPNLTHVKGFSGCPPRLSWPFSPSPWTS